MDSLTDILAKNEKELICIRDEKSKLHNNEMEKFTILQLKEKDCEFMIKTARNAIERFNCEEAEIALEKLGL